MNKANPNHGNVVPLGAAMGDVCSIVTFATGSGYPLMKWPSWWITARCQA